MSEAPAACTSAADTRAHYERILATLLDRSNPESPNWRPEFAANCRAEARILVKALAQMEDAQSTQAVAPGEPPPAAPGAPEQRPAPHPRDEGRFTHGNPGGPGRPRKIHCVEHDSVTIVVNAISPQDLHDITRIAVAQAKEGDNAARRWIYQMAYRHSRTSINEVAALQETGITPDEHRMLLAQRHYGRQMEDVELYRQEVAAQSVAQAQPGPAPATTNAAATPVVDVPAAVAKPATDKAPFTDSKPVPTATATAGDEVLEVRLSPAERNENKRRKTVENGRDGHSRSTSSGRPEPQVA